MTLPHSRFLNDASTHSESVNENYKMIDIGLKVVKIFRKHWAHMNQRAVISDKYVFSSVLSFF